jgi:flagellin-specific chaperone FliS
MQKIKNEINMLQGSLNRMCVTTSVEELDKIYDVAIRRIIKIHQCRLVQIKEQEEMAKF